MTEMSIKNLKSLLRSKLGDELIVENYVIKDLLPPGENYGSKIVDIHVSIRKGNENLESLYLVGKLLPQLEVQRLMIDFSFVFKKEIFMYSKVLPFYKKIEIDNGISGDEALDISPIYYGSHLSLDSDDCDDTVILLENLKSRGYYCTDRRTGCDLMHAELAIRAIARFHALGMAAKIKDPEFFEIMKDHAKFVLIKNPEELLSLMQIQIKELADDPVTSDYAGILIGEMKKGGMEAWMAAPPEPWSTIVHADFWANNMMYHHNDKNELDDVKLIDYQNYMFLSPMRDLVLFIACGLDHQTIGYVNRLIDLYYNTVIEQLKLLNCDTEAYSRESFDEKIREDAFIEFPHALSMLKITTVDVHADDPDSRDITKLMERSITENYKIRLRDLIQIYIDKEWFKK